MHVNVMVGLLLFVSGWGLGAQTTNQASRPITLEECIQSALRHNLDVQIQRYTPQIARFQLASSYGVYDPTFDFSARDKLFDYPAQIDPKRANADVSYQSTTEAYQTELSGRLPTGLRYGLTGSADYFTAVTPLPAFLRSTNEYLTSAMLTLQQPLLRDFWIDAPRLIIQVNKKNLKIAELTLRQQLINTVAKVQVAYGELIFANQKVKVQQEALKLAQQLLTDNRKRLAAGTLRPLEEKQTEAQVATLEGDLAVAQQARADQQNALKSLIYDDFRAASDSVLEPSEGLVAAPPMFNRAESWGKAMALRPDLLQLKLEVEKRGLEVRFRFNQLFPSLDAVGSYGGRAVQGTFGGSLGDLGNAVNPAYSYGVVLSVPLTRRAERNNYQASQAARKQAELQFRKLEQQVLVQVENAGNLVESSYSRVRSTRQARIFAEAALDAEQKRLEAGLSTTFIVLLMQRNLTDARSAEIRALADYHQALAQLAFSEGSTLEKNGLTVQVR